MKDNVASFHRAAFFRNIAAVLFLALGFAATPGRAIIFDSTTNLTYNTTAPTGVLANSGWQFEGYWAGCLATPIASNFFITGQHVGGSVGDAFLLNGTSYTTTAVYDDPGSDLAIWKVSTAFSSWAPLYTAANEAGSPLVVFGSGNGPGAAVLVDGQLKGWQWFGYSAERWGENVVTGTINYNGSTLLYANFDHGAGVNEATLASGDSGGGVFIQQNSVWSLAGVNFAVDGPFNTTNTGVGFDAAIFDQGGLYTPNGTNWDYVTPQTTNIPSSFYATSISARQDWVQSIIVPEPSAAALTGLGLVVFLATVRRRAQRATRSF